MRVAGHLYPWVWVAFALWFMVWEGLAIGTGNNKWTLSDYVWRLEDIGAGWSALRYLVAVACLWLFFHLAFGWFRLPRPAPLVPGPRQRPVTRTGAGRSHPPGRRGPARGTSAGRIVDEDQAHAPGRAAPSTTRAADRPRTRP